MSIECTKEGVKFNCSGDIGSGSVTLRQHTSVDNPEQNVEIDLTEPVSLTFSLKYLVNFCKASGLSKQVKLCLSNEVPLLVEYGLTSNSYLRFYLAPKVIRIIRISDGELQANNNARLATRSDLHSVLRLGLHLLSCNNGYLSQMCYGSAMHKDGFTSLGAFFGFAIMDFSFCGICSSNFGDDGGVQSSIFR